MSSQPSPSKSSNPTPATMVSIWFLLGVGELRVMKFTPAFAAMFSNRIVVGSAAPLDPDAFAGTNALLAIAEQLVPADAGSRGGGTDAFIDPTGAGLNEEVPAACDIVQQSIGFVADQPQGIGHEDKLVLA